MAWLHARPQPQHKATARTPAPTPSRMQALIDKGQPLPLPPAGAAPHLVGYLFEVGPTAQNGMAGAPLAWAEIEAWQHTTGIELNAWESRTLRTLSGVYLQAGQEAESPTCPAPWLPPEQVNAQTREKTARHIRSVLRG